MDNNGQQSAVLMKTTLHNTIIVLTITVVITMVILITLTICIHNNTHHGPASMLSDLTLTAGRLVNIGTMAAIRNLLPIPVVSKTLI